MRAPLALLLLAGTAACASSSGAEAPVAAIPAPSGNLLEDTAALLVAAESAGDATARAPIVARLDALQVGAVEGVEGAENDPLSTWRAEHAGDGAQVYRGRTLGPAYRRARLSAGQSLRIEQVFYAGERAELVAQTSGGDVALAVENPRSEPVCTRDLAPKGSCAWLPIYTERFAIELQNRGSESASVYIVFR